MWVALHSMGKLANMTGEVGQEKKKLLKCLPEVCRSVAPRYMQCSYKNMAGAVYTQVYTVV